MNADQIKAINQKNEFIQKPKKAKIAFTGIIIKLNKNLIIKTIGSTKRSSSNTNRKILIFLSFCSPFFTKIGEHFALQLWMAKNAYLCILL